MRANLIQTYMNNMPKVQPDKKDRNLDIPYVLSNRTFIKPLQGKGHIVDETVFDVPSVLVKDLAYDVKSLKKSASGKANDHELGKINDIGMKAGGLAIAAYLMTRKQTPLTKAMELVGLGSFFGAMALWPKIALQLPAKLVHGVNIRKEYEDSFGRKKMFFQDPQYIPWDLVDDKKINKIGDRMGVPNDIPNRRDFIQEKMKKISVQNNTLWMLTAGIATPIASALICNSLEEPLNRYLDAKTSKRADNLLDNIGTYYGKYIDQDSLQNLEKLYSANKDKPLTADLVKEIKNNLTKGLDRVTEQSLAADINEIIGFNNQKSLIDNNVVENIVNSVRKTVNSVVPDAPVPHAVDLMNKLVEKGFANRELTEIDLKKAIQVIGSEIKKTLRNANVDADEITTVLDRIVNKDKSIALPIRSNSQTVLNDSVISKLKEISKVVTDFKAKNEILNEYAYLKAGHAPETVTANAWNEVTGTLHKLFNLSDKDITAIRQDRKLAGVFLRDNLERITSEPKEYERVFKGLVEKISHLDAKIKVLDASKDAKGNYQSSVDAIFEEAAKELRKLGMHGTADSIVGSNGYIGGSLKNIQLGYVQNRLMGVRSSLYRMLNTLDLFRRVSTLENFSESFNRLPLEVKEEVVELAKKMSIEGSTSDFITKFYYLRNPNPSKEQGNLTVEAGKVVNKFLNKKVKGGRVDLPNDKKFYNEIMKLLFEHPMHSDSERILADSVIKDVLGQYRHDFAHDVGDSYYFVKQHLLLHGKQSGASSFTKALRIGMTPEQFIHNPVKQIYNTRKWLKMFGGIGAGLLGITVLSQFFFGKMKTPERIKHD